MKLLKTLTSIPLKWKVLFGIQGVVTIGMMIQRQNMIMNNKNKEKTSSN